MRYRARVEVVLKPGHFDPEGETTKRSLLMLGYPVDSVAVGKIYYIYFEAGDRDEARERVEEMCRRLLANPVKDAYNYEILGEG